ncbi:hypothetical protein ACFOU0_05945 [Salinicoccus sesuvii]|uniref:Uncharacterized protein n=1 Tax=Salinicoccus sesuvii TaxID=868281 RepID=A0ABV7N3D0_9STAP
MAVDTVTISLESYDRMRDRITELKEESKQNKSDYYESEKENAKLRSQLEESETKYAELKERWGQGR